MKKTVLAFIAFLLSFSLTSCVFLENQTPPENEKPENLIYDSDSSLAIVCGEGVADDDVAYLWDKIGNTSGNYPKISSAVSSPTEHEIVIGKCDRAASLEAYRLLDRIQKNSENYLRVLLYSDGASVAIAYDDSKGIGLAEALSVLEKLCVAKTLVMEKGVRYEDSFDKIEKLSAIDAEKRAAAWVEYEKQLTKIAGETLAKEITEEMKAFYGIYDSRIVTWLADLYDPDICVCDSLYGKTVCENHPLCGTAAFYFTPSGRDTCGYLPTVESTASAIGFTVGMGLSGELASNEFIPEEHAKKMTAFVYNLQDPDGYFYHPQWGKNISKNRRGRDFSNSLNFLNNFGVKPKYATISDVTDASAVGLRTRLGSSEAVLVSRAVLAETLVPDYLKTTDDFRAYLEALDINNRSYEAGSELATISAEIVARSEATGDPYVEILGDFLDEHQLDNGLWREAMDYAAVNGLMKISGVYNRIEREIPNVDKAIASAVAAMVTSETDKTFVDIWNPWQALVYCLTNVTSHKSADEAAKIRQGFYEFMPDAIRLTKTKLTQYMRDDGSISTYHDMGTATMMGYPCGVPNTKEGDMDASMLGTNQMINSICQALGVEKYKVKIFGEAEGELFLDRMNNATPIRKATAGNITVGEKIKFDDCTGGELPDSVIFNKDTVDRELAPGRDGGLALKVSGKRSYESVKFICDNATMPSATCYVFEADFSILSTGSGAEGLRVDIGDGGDAGAVYRLLIRSDGVKVAIWDSSSTYADYAVQNDLGIRAELGEWFSLRVEFYDMGKDNTRIKIYFNGELAAVSDNFYTAKRDAATAVPFTSYNAAMICSDSQNDPVYLIDNVHCYKSKDAYSPSRVESSLGFDVDRAPSGERVYSFDELSAAESYPELTLGGGAAVSANGKLLAMGVKDSVRILPTKRSDTFRAVALSFDISSSATFGEIAKISLLEKNYTRDAMAAFTLYVKSVDGIPTAFLKTASGEDVTGVSFAFDKTVRFGMEYYTEEKMSVFYVDGRKVGVSDYSSAINPLMEFGISEVVGLSSISLDNLICEKNDKSIERALEPAGDVIVYGEGAKVDASLLSGGATVENTGVDELISINGMGSVRLPINKRDELTNAVRLEFAVRLDNSSSSEVCEIFIEDEDLAPKIAFALTFDGAVVSLCESSIYGNHSMQLFTFEPGEEVLITLEYYETEGRCNVYLNGEYRFASTISYSDISRDTEVKSALINCISGSASLTLDELRFESYGGFSEAVALNYTNDEDNQPYITFEKSSGICLPNTISHLIKSSGNLTVKSAEREGEITKALALTTVSDGFDRIKISPVPLGNGRYVFEADVTFGSDNNASVYELVFISSGSIAYRVTVYAGDNVAVAHASAKPGDEGYYEVGNIGEWIHLRVEYSAVTEDDGRLSMRTSVFVGDRLVYTTDEPTGESVKSEITSIDFCATTSAVGSVTIDNIESYRFMD